MWVQSCARKDLLLTYHKKLRLRAVLYIVKIITTEGLNYLCEFFGSSLGVGVQKKYLPMREPSESCGIGYKINVLDIREGIKDRVIFQYGHGTSKLFVSICCSHFIICDVSISD